MLGLVVRLVGRPVNTAAAELVAADMDLVEIVDGVGEGNMGAEINTVEPNAGLCSQAAFKLLRTRACDCD